MNEELELVRHDTGAVAKPSPSEMTAGQALQAIVERGVTPESVEAFQKLVIFMEDRKAQQEFTAAFVKLQKALPTITASTPIPNRGKYERFEDVMRVVGPLLSEHGFSVSFSNDFKDNRILQTCHLSHVGGATRSNTFAVRVGRGDSETQADCKAATTAKRNALLNALNIVIRQDYLNEENDAGMEGDPNAKVTAAQATELEHRVKMTNSNVTAFLAVAKAKTFAEIPANRYAELDSMLRRKEGQGR